MISVLTPTVPGRERMLAECKASVAAQTLPALEHLVLLDETGEGRCGPVLNRLAEQAAGGWLAVLADDDLMLPNHLERHARYADTADVIYAWCRVEGRAWDPNQPFDEKRLREGSCIPATCLVRRDLWGDVGGWGSERSMEDWHFWLRCLDAGARFHCIEEITWVYRFHGANKSLDQWP